MAVESETQSIDISRVSGFMQKVRVCRDIDRDPSSLKKQVSNGAV